MDSDGENGPSKRKDGRHSVHASPQMFKAAPGKPNTQETLHPSRGARR